MVYQVSVNSNFDLNKKNDFSFTDKDYKFSFTKDENIFVGDETAKTEYSVEESTEILEAQLQEIQDKNGYKMQLWDKTKNALNVGANSEKCEKSIEKYKNASKSLCYRPFSFLSTYISQVCSIFEMILF